MGELRLEVGGNNGLNMIKSAKFLITVIALTCLCACSTVQKTLSFIPGVSNPDNTHIRSIHINSHANTNENSAVQMDVLFLTSNRIASTLPVTAAEWFDQKPRLLANNAGDLILSSVELSPGGRLDMSMPRGYKNAKDVIAYVNYLSASGQKWLRLPNSKSVYVDLGQVTWKPTSTAK